MVFRLMRVALFMVARLFGNGLAGFKGKKAQMAYLKWAYIGWSHTFLKAFDVELVVKGREHIPKGVRSVVVLSNHQSQLDIPSLVASLNQVLGFVAKQELGKIPLLSYWMRQVGCIFINRGNRSEAQKALEKAAAQIGENPIVVFPEGTRSKTGELLPFKQGGARLALLAKALILPARIEGTRNAFEARQSDQSTFKVTVTYFPVLDAALLANDKAGSEQIKTYVEGCWKHTGISPGRNQNDFQ